MASRNMLSKRFGRVVFWPMFINFVSAIGAFVLAIATSCAERRHSQSICRHGMVKVIRFLPIDETGDPLNRNPPFGCEVAD